jgi:catechol 2,3-dioxygenase-like lactoylglutathione lyase family enzyme
LWRLWQGVGPLEPHGIGLAARRARSAGVALLYFTLSARRSMVRMLGPIDHVGYLASDCEHAVAELSGLMGLEITRRFDRPEYSLFGAYLGTGPGNVEVFSFSDDRLLSHRLGGDALRLDHVAYLVDDIREAAKAMRKRGVRFCGPDLRTEVTNPIELSGVRHLWTVPALSEVSLQLVER